MNTLGWCSSNEDPKRYRTNLPIVFCAKATEGNDFRMWKMCKLKRTIHVLASFTRPVTGNN